MPTLMLYGLRAGLAGGLAALGMLPVCALLRKGRAPEWLLCALWGAVGLRFVLPGGLLPLPLPAASGADITAPGEMLGALSPAALPAAAAPAQESGPGLWRVLGAVWLAGAAVLVLRELACYLRLRRTLALACRTPDGAYSCPAVGAPFTLGLLRPRVYLPDSLQGPARAAVLRHEQAHIRRRDPLTKPLFYLVACLHWWNPLVWLAFSRFELAMEYACDEAAIRALSPARRALYCESLLRFAVGGPRAGCLAFGQRGVQRRIRHLLGYRRPAAVRLGLCLAGAFLAATVCLAAPRQQQAALPEEASLPAAEPAEDTAFSPQELTSPLDFYLYISRRYTANAHRGDDLIAPTGTTVSAAAGGTVLVAQFHQSYGNYVLIDHGADRWGRAWQTLYAHLVTLAVAAGDTVTAHQAIGTVGSTGTSTGPHLHLELLCADQPLAPSAWISYRGGAS